MRIAKSKKSKGEKSTTSSVLEEKEKEEETWKNRKNGKMGFPNRILSFVVVFRPGGVYGVVVVVSDGW